MNYTIVLERILRSYLPLPRGASFDENKGPSLIALVTAHAKKFSRVEALRGVLWVRHDLAHEGVNSTEDDWEYASKEVRRALLEVIHNKECDPSTRESFLLIPESANPILRAGATKVNPKDGLTYVWIPPGTFEMGCQRSRFEFERPLHQVTISSGFWMGQTEVTQEAYQRVMGRNPSRFKGEKLPVERVSWYDAQNYCQAVGMRLSTEAEWEYAARAGSTEERYGEIYTIAWFSDNSGHKTHEVGGKLPSAWGLYDMLGNVWEWVADWFDAYEPSKMTVIDPQGPPNAKKRVLRGGAFCRSLEFVRVTNRYSAEPALGRGTSFKCAIGFRCAGGSLPCEPGV